MPLRIKLPPKNLQLRKWAGCLLVGACLAGCSSNEKNLWYLGDRELHDYKDTVTAIEYPAVNEETADEASYTDEPRRIRKPRKDEVWNLSLEEALHTALANNEIIRDASSYQSPNNRLLTNPDFASSIYDPALQETNPLFGQNGMESALSEFDASLTTSLLVGRSAQISESFGLNGIRGGDTTVNKSGDFRSSLNKIFADGSQFSVSHNVLYQDFNSGSSLNPNDRLFRNFYTNNPSAGQNGGIPGIEFDLRRPLWSGAGTKFTRTAGPISRRPALQNTPQVNQGVVIARIRTDIALAEFEGAVLNLAKDVEDSYWNLYLAYRRFDADVVARNSSLRTWREVHTKFVGGVEGGGAADEAQARDSYYDVRSRSEESQANLYETEGLLRRLMGLPVNDGRIIRPADEPTTAELVPDWRSSLVEALSHRLELRKQKWNLHMLSLEVDAAKSLTKPRLDFVSRYQINGFGKGLFDNTDSSAVLPGSNVSSSGVPTDSFYGNLLSGNQTGWGLGFEFSMPIGFRAAHAQVRNLELKLAKAKAALGMQEHEISHELATAFRQLDSSFQGAQTNFNRRNAAKRRLEAYEAQYQTGRANVDLLLRSQISLAQAETSYYQSLVNYNRSIMNLKYRKGTLLDDDRIYLSESLSHPESYPQALRRAWARSYGLNAKHLKTEPPEFVTDSPDPVEMGSGPIRHAEHTESSLAPQPLPPSAGPVTPMPPPNRSYEEESPTKKISPDDPKVDSVPAPPSEPTIKKPNDADKASLVPPEPTARFQLDDGFQTAAAEEDLIPPPGPKIQPLHFQSPKRVKKNLDSPDIPADKP